MKVMLQVVISLMGLFIDLNSPVVLAATPKAPTQVCANNICPPKTSPYVIAWKFIPMKYSANESNEQMRMDDVRSAAEMGLDGFGLEAYNNGHAINLMKNWISSANQLGATNFRFFLILDMGATTFTAQNIIDLMSTYGNDPHYFKINGKPVLSTYNGYASELGDSWWKANVITPLNAKGHPIFFVPYFDRSLPNAITPTYQNWTALISQFPSVDGLLLFSPAKGLPFYQNDPNGGNQTWSGLETEENEAQALHDQRKFYISPYQPYYWQNCKEPRPYYEYQGGRGMDNYWRSAIYKQKADMITLITWDDYSESTFVQPTTIPLSKYPGITVFPHLAYYELEKYYIAWYKDGIQPTITKDALFVFYRTHPNNAIASNDASACPLGPISETQKWGRITDSIYVTTALTYPAQLLVSSGGSTHTVQIPAGITTTDIPFNTGAQSFLLQRLGKTVTQLTGQEIIANPQVYNFNLYSAYSIAGSYNSNNWQPSDVWKSGGPVASWFSK